MPLLLLVMSLFRLLSFTTGDGGDDPKPEKVKASELLERYGGDAVKMAERLADLSNDNYDLRHKNSNLTRSNDDLKGKVPAEGTVILSKDDAALLDTYRALGTPDVIKTQVETGAAAVQERDTLKRSNTIRTIADVAGYKPTVLERLGPDLEYRVKDVQETVNGKAQTVKRAFVVKDDKETPLGEYATREWTDFLSALTVEPATPERPAYGTPPREQRQPVFTPLPDEEAAKRSQSDLYRQF